MTFIAVFKKNRIIYFPTNFTLWPNCVSANIFGGNFPRNFIPSFTWSGSSGFATYQTNKAFQTAKKVMERRNEELTKKEQEILTSIFNDTSELRFWEKTSIK